MSLKGCFFRIVLHEIMSQLQQVWFKFDLDVHINAKIFFTKLIVEFFSRGHSFEAGIVWASSNCSASLNFGQQL